MDATLELDNKDTKQNSFTNASEIFMFIAFLVHKVDIFENPTQKDI